MIIRTIIAKATQSVYRNGEMLINLPNLPIPANVSQLVWNDDSVGWIEPDPFNKFTDIVELPSWARECIAIYEANLPPPPEPYVPPTAEENKQTASQLLYETDWTQIPDVTDPAKSDPYLTNPDEFAQYRVLIREIAINPVAGWLDWPLKPNAKWSPA